jgi:potassium-transporting ATPase ATP-binding subunit
MAYSTINETGYMRNFKTIRSTISVSLRKLSPRYQLKNPVMFTVYIGSLLVSGIYGYSMINNIPENFNQFNTSLIFWLWLTLLFANFAETVAENRGKAQADTLRKSREEITAKKLSTPDKNSQIELVLSKDLKIGDYVFVESGDIIPGDGEIISSIASVDESAITGESAPVIKGIGTSYKTVTGNTQVISDHLIIKITANLGDTFLDRMITLVEGANRSKTPNELALTILLAALTLVFLIVSTTLLPFSIYSTYSSGVGKVISITSLVAILVCLAPTTIGGLLSAIGISGIDRMLKANVIALSGQAVEAAGDVDILLMDKTGTITLGNRKAVEFIPAEGVDIGDLASVALLSSLEDETPEGISILSLAREKYGIQDLGIKKTDAKFIPFTANTRMSGVDFKDKSIRKGSTDAIIEYVKKLDTILPVFIDKVTEEISKSGGTPLLIAENAKILGVIHLKDVIKTGIKDRFDQLRKSGIKTIMITGDNKITARTIAKEAGVDDFLAETVPEDKFRLILNLQAKGHIVAMIGDGTNDAPALAQANVGVAMNTGTQEAKEASNFIDLDSNPTKLIEIIRIGKQLLITRGALTTFSIANDLAKYFAIIPAAFSGTYPVLEILNIMNLSSSETAILSAIIFNALIILFLVPLALVGVKYKNSTATDLLKRNIFIYGIGGLLAPFIGIKLIDMALTTFNYNLIN